MAADPSVSSDQPCRVVLGSADDPDPRVAELLGPNSPHPGVVDSNVFRALARHPGMFRRFTPFAMKILHGGKLPARDRELCILRVAYRCRSGYEWAHHVAIGTECGLTEDEVRRVVDDPATAAWSAHDRALVAAVDELHDDHAMSDRTWEQLARTYDEAQLVEVPLLVGTYQALAGVLRTLRIPLDDHLTATPLTALVTATGAAATTP